jgi:CrcB protein
LADVLLVALGGALGSVARWLGAGWVQQRAGLGFPWGTLTVNVAGCLCITFIMETAVSTLSFGPRVRLFGVVGFLGGFTTFSTFSYETIRLMEEGAFGAAAGNALGSLAACLGAAQLGLWLARWVLK